MSFVDIAGIVAGASEGAGLGNKFLANIREADAICQVVRVFADDDVVHVDGRVDPAADIETIATELVLADLQTLDKALPRLEKEARVKKETKAAVDEVQHAQSVLNEGRTLFSAGLDSPRLRELNLHDGQAVPLRLQRRRAGARRRREAQGARRARRPGRGRVPRREGRAGAARARRRVGRRSCWSRSVSPSRVSTRWPAPASAPSACRPTSRRAPRSRAPGRSGSAPPPPRRPA